MTREDLEKSVLIGMYSKQFYISHPYMVYDSSTGWYQLCYNLDEAKSCRDEYIVRAVSSVW